MLKLFYVTDIHGSNVCYRKFLNALPIYGVDVAILNGDLLGKVLVPLVDKAGGGRECHLMGQYTEMKTPEELAATKKTIENAGYYWVEQTREEYEAARSDPVAIDALFKKRAIERIEEWLALADERLAGKSSAVYICPGNDDWWEIDDMIAGSKTLHPCDDMIVEFDGYTMLSSSRSNPTPWDTPREASEEVLTEYLEGLCQRVGTSPKDFENVIFNFHVPPYGYSLDLCPKLDANMRMAAEEKIHAGSVGAKQVIEKYQPLLGLHGHIHESRGAQKAGRTLLINPGSEYSEGILKGVMVMLDKKKIKDYVFTSGFRGGLIMPKPFILPKDIPIDRYPKPEVFLSEGRRIVDAAREAGFPLRVMGPLALHYYFPERVELYARLERLGERYFTDIDFAAYGKSGGKMKGLMEKLNYDCDVNTLMMTGKTRQIYYGGAVPMIDVFLDKLDYCHEVTFKDRLEFDAYCIPLTDITLQKLQIWEINDKDLKDLEFLFTTADVGDDEAKKINRTYIAKRLGDDWGFWYTATVNLGRVKAHVDGVAALDEAQKRHVRARCDELLARIESEPKTKDWQKRAKKGTDKIWYNQNFSDW